LAPFSITLVLELQITRGYFKPVKMMKIYLINAKYIMNQNELKGLSPNSKKLKQYKKSLVELSQMQ
jgi:hypothetical protein